MENNHRFLPERKNRGNRMSELAKDEGKMLEDDKYGIFKEDSSDDDFNPDDVKNAVNSSSAEENEEGEEGEGEEGEEVEDDESNEEDINEDVSANKNKSPKKKNKKEEEILDIDQLDIDKIDMIEDLKDRGIDISDEEELERRMKEYNEESEREDEEEKKIEKLEKIEKMPGVEVIKKKRGRKSKKELEMMRKKRGRKKKIVEKDDNIFLSNKPATVELNYNKIIIDNTDININNNNMNLNEEEQEPKIESGNISKIKKSKKEKINKDLGLDPDQYFSNISKINNPNILSEDNNILTINKRCLTESIPSLSYVPPTNLDYIELNNYNEKQQNKISRKYKKLKNIEKNLNYNNSGIIEINKNNIIINKKLRNRNNENIFSEKLDNSNNENDIIGYKRTRHENNLIDFFKKQKKEKPNKNVTIVGNRENPKYIYISKKIYDENDEEKEIRKEEKKKKKKEREKEREKEDEKEKEKERINFDLEQEMDTKNIIMKYKQQEKEKKQFGIQNKIISQEQRLFESIFTELTNKQSLKTMQKLEDLNKRDNYLYTSKKAFKDFVKITNSERHILEEKLNNQNNNIENNKTTNNNNINESKNKNEDINSKDTNTNKIIVDEEKEKINNENDNKENIENKDNKEDKENKNDVDGGENLDNKENKDKIDNLDNKENKDIKDINIKAMEEEYKEKEKKLNKVRVTFTNKEYFRIFNNLNKKPIKDKKEKLCAITGKPAKYFDPLTKNYYSTIDAFKILRERYYQNEEDRLLFKIQTLSDLASQKKERLKKMIMSENDKPKEQVDFIFNNNEVINKNSNSIKIDSETMSIEENNNENSGGNKYLGGNSALLKMINKFGLLKNDVGNEEKKVISHRIYNRNRENCVESGMLLEANKVKLIISKKIFKDKYSSKLPAPEMTSE